MQTGHITPTTKVRNNLHPQTMVTLLYYARVVDPTVMVALGSISSNQDNINETTAQSIKQLLYYCDTHKDATICYKKNRMVIRIHSDSS